MDAGGEMSGSTPTVLLFYDGFEHRARPGPVGYVASQTHRFARFSYRTLRRRQTRTGFYTWFVMLCRALKHAGVRVRINDFAAAAAAPNTPIGAAGYPSVLTALDRLTNPRLVGPGLYGNPLENPDLFKDPRNVLYLQTCDWNGDMFKPWFGDRQRPWFGGFDVADFPALDRAARTNDVLIYDKIYFDRDELYPRLIGAFVASLEARGLTYKIIRYGHYHYSDYLDAVRASRCMAFFAHSETQGMAYQECLASNTPIFAWDEGVWPSPVAKELGLGPIACTSVPYFDQRCGMRFKASTMLEAWTHFYPALDQFEPRRFIAEDMTLQKSAELYLKAYRETAMAAQR